MLDASRCGGGAACARILAQLGAEVAQVEASTTPDLSQPGGAGMARATSPFDLVIIDLQPWEASAQGLDPATPVDPGRVVISITPFGLDGPDADATAAELERRCAWLGRQATAQLAGAHAVVAGLAAWRWARRTGRGAFVEVAEQEVAAACLGEALPAAMCARVGVRDAPPSLTLPLRGGGDGVHPLRGGGDGVRPLTGGGDGVRPLTGGGDGVRPLTGGGSGVRPLTSGSNAVRPLTGGRNIVVLPCADGFVGIDARTDVDREHLAALTGVEGAADMDADLGALVAPWVRARTRGEIVEAGQLWRIPVVPVLSPAEVLADEQSVARGFWERDVEGRPTAGSPFKFNWVGGVGGTSTSSRQFAPPEGERVSPSPSPSPVEGEGTAPDPSSFSPIGGKRLTPPPPLRGRVGVGGHGPLRSWTSRLLTRLDSARGEPAPPHVALRQAQGERVFQQLAADDSPVSPASRGAGEQPLAGVRVLDLGMVWAGPYCGRLLASLGAEVVKVEGPRRPDGTRPQESATGCSGVFADLNRGKASLVLDLAAPSGRDALLRLATHADILIENFTPRVMPNFGLDRATLRAVNPRLIGVAMPAFGAYGPWANYVSYGSGLELATGLARYTPDGTPQPAPVPYLDYLAGAYGAVAAIAALIARDRAGHGSHVEVAQREVACQLLEQLGESESWVALKSADAFNQIQGTDSSHSTQKRPLRLSTPRKDESAPGGTALTLTLSQRERGFHSNERSQSPRHGQLAGAVGSERELEGAVLGPNRQLKKPAHPELVEGPGGSTGSPRAEPKLFQQPAEALARDPQLVARGLFTSAPADSRFCYHYARPPWRLHGVASHRERGAPEFGANSRLILEGWAGLVPEEVEEMIAAGAVVAREEATGSDATNVAVPKVVDLVGACHAAPAGDACVAPTNAGSNGHQQNIRLTSDAVIPIEAVPLETDRLTPLPNPPPQGGRERLHPPNPPPQGGRERLPLPNPPPQGGRGQVRPRRRPVRLG